MDLALASARIALWSPRPSRIRTPTLRRRARAASPWSTARRRFPNCFPHASSWPWQERVASPPSLPFLDMSLWNADSIRSSSTARRSLAGMQTAREWVPCGMALASTPWRRSMKATSRLPRSIRTPRLSRTPPPTTTRRRRWTPSSTSSSATSPAPSSTDAIRRGSGTPAASSMRRKMRLACSRCLARTTARTRATRSRWRLRSGRIP